MNQPATGPWQEGEPWEERTYLVQVNEGGAFECCIGEYKYGKWHVEGRPLLVNRHVCCYAHIDAPNA